MSRAQPEMIHVLLTEAEVEALRKDKKPFSKEFKRQLRKVLNAK